jgi:ATP-dependent Clp protease protease subunit
VFPPDRSPPERTTPAWVPTVYEPAGSLYDELLERRTVFLRGRLDTDTANRLALELMTLDGRSAKDIELMINSPGGPLGDAMGVLDVLGLVRGKVNTVAMGQAMGTAAVLLACGTGRRRVAANATVSLRCAELEEASGTAAEVAARAAIVARQRERVRDLVVEATGRTAGEIDAALDHGHPLRAEEAVAFGLVDERAGRRP